MSTQLIKRSQLSLFLISPVIVAWLHGLGARRRQASPAKCRNRISWAKPSQSSTGQLYPQQCVVFDPMAHSGQNVCSEEEINRIEALVDALLGGSYQHAKAGGIAEGTP